MEAGLGLRTLWEERGASAWFEDGPAPEATDFGNPVEEWRALRGGCGIVDRHDRTKLLLQGQDRVNFLHNFCTQDIRSLPVGGVCEAFATNVKGRVLGHLLVAALPDALYIEAEAGLNERLVGHFGRYVIREDVQIVDWTDALVSLWLIGPESDAIVAELAGDSADACVFGDGDRFCVRLPFFDVPAHSIVVLSALAPAIAREAMSLGAAAIGRRAFEALRVASLLPQYGRDISDEHLANEVGRTAECISFTKGCYLGQEPIARADAIGHINRVLRGVRFADGGKDALACGVLDGCEVQAVSAESGSDQEARGSEPPTGQVVGRISSSVVGPDGGEVWAMGVLRTTAAQPATPVATRDRSGRWLRGEVYDRASGPL